MGEIILKAENITKYYGKQLILNEMNLSLEKGKIYGFIGNNGAGKTTFMRIIAGLVMPTSGTIELFGATEQKKIEKERKRVGFLIESPIYLENLSAGKNLEIIANAKGNQGKEQIDKLLELVHLEGTGKKKLRDFSTGMRQRYGIAAALLNNPEFLVLDEPMNGLDPEGIREMRQLFQTLHREKQITFLISSHILGELDMISTDYLFIREGRIVEQISHKEWKEKYGAILLEDYFLQQVGR